MAGGSDSTRATMAADSADKSKTNVEKIIRMVRKVNQGFFKMFDPYYAHECDVIPNNYYDNKKSNGKK